MALEGAHDTRISPQSTCMSIWPLLGYAANRLIATRIFSGRLFCTVASLALCAWLVALGAWGSDGDAAQDIEDVWCARDECVEPGLSVLLR